MLGRAPKELIDLIGYNPVVEVDWKDPRGQVAAIVDEIGRYQSFVDRNRKIALEFGNWRVRMPLLVSGIRDVYADIPPIHIQSLEGGAPGNESICFESAASSLVWGEGGQERPHKF